MPIPIEVSYKTIGKRTERNVIGALFPTALSQTLHEIGYARYAPVIYVYLGDASVDWDKSSPGYETFMNLSYNVELSG